MPNTARSIPSGNGGRSGWPFTKCSAGTGISDVRPGRASSGAIMCCLFEPNRNLILDLLIAENSLAGPFVRYALAGTRSRGVGADELQHPAPGVLGGLAVLVGRTIEERVGGALVHLDLVRHTGAVQGPTELLDVIA